VNIKENLQSKNKGSDRYRCTGTIRFIIQCFCLIERKFVTGDVFLCSWYKDEKASMKVEEVAVLMKQAKVEK